MERVVNATRQVQVAFTALQGQYPPQGSGKPSKIALQTFDAALQALEDAQAAFDEVLNDLLDGNR
ncbi:Type VII secretion effector, SACOL2603 family [Cupriavidus sp. H18C2]